MNSKQPTDNERIKQESDFLRGHLAEAFADVSTGDLSADEQQLIKFHGTYLQDDRDQRPTLKKAGKEKAWSFMLRLRMPGGRITPAQWLALDSLASEYGNGTLKLTTRQTVQIYGVLKRNMKATMQEIHRIAMDTLATCGDVARNVTASGYPEQSLVHRDAHELADAISAALLPKTHAYHEIWLDEQRIYPVQTDEEPVYGKTYLPRKFKIGIAVPPDNDIDVLTNDLGFIAIVEAGGIVGYNITAGGGMGCSHGNPATFPRLADTIGFCRPDQVVDVAKAVMLLQRDYGDRTDRKYARLKYTIADRGIDWFRQTLADYPGAPLQPAREFHFDSTGDSFTPRPGSRTIYIDGGRVADKPDYNLRTAIRNIALIHKGDFFLTANQHLIIAGIAPEMEMAIDSIIAEYNLNNRHSGMRLNSIACTALPTCPLALAESERFMPQLLGLIEESLDELELRSEPIVTRMTGCPNGCARPYNAELGFVGRAPGKYNIWIGGSHQGTRLAQPYRESVKTEELADLVVNLLLLFKETRQPGERFGDWAFRTGQANPVTPEE